MNNHLDILEFTVPTKEMINPCRDEKWKFLCKLRQAWMPWYLSQHKITKKDIVWVLDNTAYQSSDGKWEAEFITSVFRQNTGVQRTSDLIVSCLEKFGFISGERDKARLQERLTPCLQSLLPGRTVKIDFNKKRNIRMKMSPSGLGGISRNIKSLPAFEDGKMVTSLAKVPLGTRGILQMKTQYAEPEGWAVISGWFELLIMVDKKIT